jgi:ribA/ribD-fused uncharacterized protein
VSSQFFFVLDRLALKFSFFAIALDAMALDIGSVDLSGFKKKTICGGRQYDEFSNFYPCQILVEEKHWPTSEHYYQALKFPGPAHAQLREELRFTASPMECWKLGNSHSFALRQDWEVVKLEMMYIANLSKFSNSEHLKRLLVDCHGPIVCDGGLFWATWNAVILERIREELRDDAQKDHESLHVRVALMESYSKTASVGDQRSLESVTVFASRRQLAPKAEVAPVTLSGLEPESSNEEVLKLDLIKPEINGQPHWVSDAGLHLYLGKKRSQVAWVLDECCMETEATGHAFLTVLEDTALPCGAHVWQCWDESSNRHVAKQLVIIA